VKSPAMMLGYIDNEQATREAFDSDGWLRTGDVGRLTEGNKVFVVDRKKDLMKVRGWQVSPVEVESVLLQHPDIVDAGVVGIPLANNTGEIPRAYIVVRAEAVLSDEEVKKFAARSLAKYKVPEEIVFLDQIPKNPTGKVLRRTLRERAIGSIKQETSSHSIEQGTAKGPWRYVRTLSYPVTQGTKHLYRLLSWLASFLVQISY
jgi:4-coumarate--CoA ligase